MSDLEKKLIILSYLGITIEHADGHRWIEYHETINGFSFDKELKEHGLLLNNKIYGGVLQAINVIDRAIYYMWEMDLLEFYNKIFLSQNYGVEINWDSGHEDNRIKITETGEGGLV